MKVTSELLAEIKANMAQGYYTGPTATKALVEEIERLREALEPVPEDVWEVVVHAAYDATRLEDGTPEFASAGFCLGHAAKIAEAVQAGLQAKGWGPK